MSQKSDLAAKRSMRFSNKLLQRLGCLGSLGVFSSGMALAQTPSPTPSAAPSVVVPTEAAADPTPPAMTSAAPSPAVVAPPEQIAPEPPVPVVIEQNPVPASPAPSVAPQPEAATAPNTYEAPDSIIFSERSSGCQFSVSPGKTAAEACGTAPSKPVATSKAAGLSKTVSNLISGVVRPKFASPDAAVASAAPVRVGPISLSSSGIGFSPNSVVKPSEFVQNYYNRTVRPLGRVGNGNISLLFPLSIPAAITSLFGWRVHPISGTTRMHTGTDIGAPLGTPVLAALTGRVIMADFFGGYGLSIALEHKDGTQQTLYAHLSEIFVKPGDVINQGAVIGRVGSTGASTGPHLHFEYRQQLEDGEWVAQDAGFALETAMGQLVKSLQVAQSNPTPEIPQVARQ